MSTGNKGRFSDRLKKLAFFKRKKSTIKNNDKISVDNVLKASAVVPSLVLNFLSKDEDLSNKKEVLLSTKSINIDNSNNNSNENSANLNNNVNIDISPINVDKVSNVSLNKNNTINITNLFATFDKETNDAEKTIDDSQNVRIDVNRINNLIDSLLIYDDNLIVNNKFESNDGNGVEKLNSIRNLEKKIINTIKKDLIFLVNELEIIDSELYVLNDIYNDDVSYNNCAEKLDEVKNLICRIDKLKEQYDYLKDNYDFEYFLDYNNKSLIDDVIDLKRMIDENGLKKVTNEYKILDVFQSQCLVLDKIHNEADELYENVNVKKNELNNRDIDFNKLQVSAYNMVDVNSEYNKFVMEQSDIINNIQNNASKISSKEVISYKYDGLNSLFLNSFKYLGLFMLSPFRGIFPGIVTQMVITRNVVKNLYNNLHVDVENKMIYSAIDLSNEIYNELDNLSSISNSIDLTLEELVKLKEEYNNKFMKYHRDFLKYRETYNMICDMENKVLGNKIKVEMMQERLRISQQENSKKLSLVKNLNEN